MFEDGDDVAAATGAASSSDQLDLAGVRVHQDEVEDIARFTGLVAPSGWNHGNVCIVKHVLGTKGLLDVDVQPESLRDLEAQDPHVVLAHLPGDLRRDDQGAFLQFLARAGRSQESRGRT